MQRWIQIVVSHSGIARRTFSCFLRVGNTLSLNRELGIIPQEVTPDASLLSVPITLVAEGLWKLKEASLELRFRYWLLRKGLIKNEPRNSTWMIRLLETVLMKDTDSTYYYSKINHLKAYTSTSNMTAGHYDCENCRHNTKKSSSKRVDFHSFRFSF